MILTCPECSTRYHVDAASLGGEGRTVRCANCGHRWLARPPADAATVVPLTRPQPPRMRPVATAEKAQGGGSTSLVGWLAAVLIVLILASAVIGRNEIAGAFPTTARIYQKLGLPVTIDLGLQFEDVTTKRFEEGGISVLVVEGEIVNVSPHERPVPPVRVTLLDRSGREVQQELFRAKDESLQAGGKTTFTGRVVNPAEQARNFRVTFDVP